VLFSEPKIPQTLRTPALNSSPNISVLFSEPKIPQIRLWIAEEQCDKRPHFSALQRAENSSKRARSSSDNGRKVFQCSSASRKFLKCGARSTLATGGANFSALQRAENSSNKFARPYRAERRYFSALQRAENSSNAVGAGERAAGDAFQCSSASRKFLKRGRNQRHRLDCLHFSALQRAENSSNA